jgi:prepilin-type N-terminal cleavage/methylation domain-containing protein
MLSRAKQQRSEGFTIIEVLIVLAIAGLILLVVFMAVPALQRNSRNTQRKSDVSSLLGAASEYVSNNGGKLPVTSGNFDAVFTGSVPKLGFYANSSQAVYNYSATARGSAPTAAAGNDTVTVYNYLKCNGNTATTSGASARSIAAVYNIEDSGGDVPQCQES